MRLSTEPDKIRKRRCCKGLSFIKDVYPDGYDAPPGAEYASLGGDAPVDQRAQIVKCQVKVVVVWSGSSAVMIAKAAAVSTNDAITPP